MADKYLWMLYVALAGLSWGTYVPLIAQGGKELGGNRFGALLCVGVAYFLIAVLLPLALFALRWEPWPSRAQSSWRCSSPTTPSAQSSRSR